MYPVRSRITALGNVDAAQRRILTVAAHSDPKVREALVRQQEQQSRENQEAAKDDAKQMEQAIKREAIEAAVSQAGLTIALSFIPAVGSLVSSVASYALGKSMERYAGKLKAHIRKKTAEIEAHVAMRQKQYNEAISNSYMKAYRKAAPLALSWQPLEFTESERDEVLNEATLYEAFGQLQGYLGVIDKLTGKDMYEKGKREIDAIAKKAKQKIDEITLPIIRKVKEPGFVALVAKTIAVEMRNNPQFIRIAKQVGVPPPSRFTGMEPPGTPTSGHRPLPHTQTHSLRSQGGASTLPSTGPDRLPSTGDKRLFMQDTDKAVDEAVDDAGTIRTVATIGAVGIGLFLLLGQ